MRTIDELRHVILRRRLQQYLLRAEQKIRSGHMTKEIQGRAELRVCTKLMELMK